MACQCWWVQENSCQCQNSFLTKIFAMQDQKECKVKIIIIIIIIIIINLTTYDNSDCLILTIYKFHWKSWKF